MQTTGDWTDQEVARFLRREQAFINHGLNERDAEKLAEQLLYRDRPEEADDRRVCFECTHFAGRRCRTGQPPLPFVLQRCPGFELKRSN